MSKKDEKNKSPYRSLIVWKKSFDLSFAHISSYERFSR
jgi:hypothetical protein